MRWQAWSRPATGSRPPAALMAIRGRGLSLGSVLVPRPPRVLGLVNKNETKPHVRRRTADGRMAGRLQHYAPKTHGMPEII